MPTIQGNWWGLASDPPTIFDFPRSKYPLGIPHSWKKMFLNFRILFLYSFLINLPIPCTNSDLAKENDKNTERNLMIIRASMILNNIYKLFITLSS